MLQGLCRRKKVSLPGSGCCIFLLLPLLHGPLVGHVSGDNWWCSAHLYICQWLCSPAWAQGPPSLDLPNVDTKQIKPCAQSGISPLCPIHLHPHKIFFLLAWHLWTSSRTGKPAKFSTTWWISTTPAPMSLRLGEGHPPKFVFPWILSLSLVVLLKLLLHLYSYSLIALNSLH